MYLLRNKFLNTAAMLLAPPDDNKSVAQTERDNITVDSFTNDEHSDDQNKNNDNNENDDENEEDEDDENVDDEENKDEDKDKEKEEDEQETEEQKTARLAKEKEEAKLARKNERQQRKWDRLAGEKKAAEDRVKELEAQLAEKTVDGLTEEEVERRAEARAEEKRKADKILADQKEFEKNCDTLEDAAKKVDKDFTKKINELVQDIGSAIPNTVINTLVELDHGNGGEVLAYLANNVDEAEDVFELKDDARKLTIKLTRISDKLVEAKKAPKRQRSNLPPPIEPVTEGNRKDSTGPLTGKESMEDFVAKRNKQIAEKRAAQGLR